jgi:hypothetical protein
MKKTAPNIVVTTLDDVLGEHGFIRKKKSWYSDKPETILVVALQKSQWSRSYSIILGVSIKKMSADFSPNVNLCPIGYQLETLVVEHERLTTKHGECGNGNARTMFFDLSANPKDPIQIATDNLEYFSSEGLHVPKILTALDLENVSMTEAERMNAIKLAMNTHGFPFFSAFESLERIRDNLRARMYPTAHIWASVYELFGLPIP